MVPSVRGEVCIVVVGELFDEDLPVDAVEDIVYVSWVVVGAGPCEGLSFHLVCCAVSRRELDGEDELGEGACGGVVGVAWVVGIGVLGVGFDEDDSVWHCAVASYVGGGGLPPILLCCGRSRCVGRVWIVAWS